MNDGALMGFGGGIEFLWSFLFRKRRWEYIIKRVREDTGQSSGFNRSVEKTATNCEFPLNAENLLTKGGTISFSRMALQHVVSLLDLIVDILTYSSVSADWWCHLERRFVLLA